MSLLESGAPVLGWGNIDHWVKRRWLRVGIGAAEKLNFDRGLGSDIEGWVDEDQREVESWGSGNVKSVAVRVKEG